MEFDTVRYSAAMDDFLGKIEPVRVFDGNAVSGALENICGVLRIAEISVVTREAPGMGGRPKGPMGPPMGQKGPPMGSAGPKGPMGPMGPMGPAAPKEKYLLLFSSGTPDREDPVKLNEVNVSGDTGEYSLFRQAGTPGWTEEELARVRLLGDTLAAFICKMRTEKIMERLMYTDSDLEIHNLPFFLKTAGMLIGAGKIGGYCSCYFNLKRFSVVNQDLGRQKGTLVMKEYVRRLQDKLGSGNYVCRIGGDNFVILFEKSLLNTVMEYLNGTGVSYEPGGEKVFLSAYAGYYMIPDDCPGPTDIMDNLSVAVNAAKNVLNTEYVFFDDNLIRTRNAEKALESVFPSALREERFRVYYQPKVYLKNYSLSGAEALCRWDRNGRIVSPGDFVPTLEQSRNICLLDFYVLEHVCEDIRRWLDAGLPVVRVSVNFSRRHLGNMNVLERIISTIDNYKVPHEYIEIELTETTTDVDFGDLKVIVNGLKAAGISTAVDDFGMGYSSLNLIRELPWNVLKIDKSFMPEGNRMSSRRYAMLKHVIALAQDMGLECIAEGVETFEHVRLLKENNCFLAQGFYFDKPLPVTEFEERLADLRGVNSPIGTFS